MHVDGHGMAPETDSQRPALTFWACDGPRQVCATRCRAVDLDVQAAVTSAMGQNMASLDIKTERRRVFLPARPLAVQHPMA